MCITHQGQQASMRPRFFNRGKDVEGNHRQRGGWTSMRPRFFNRGKTGLGGDNRKERTTSMRPRFFNRGKRPWAARSGGAQCITSMRPRFFNRGKGGDPRRDVGSNRPTSMRPRFFNRGKRILLGLPLCWSLDFNEAAVLQPRKEPRVDSRSITTSDFNEAAVLQPRKGDARHREGAARNTSMRPRFFNRGKLPPDTLTSPQSKLQ